MAYGKYLILKNDFILKSQMHVLYPINIYYDDNAKSANSSHNTEYRNENPYKIDAMCGTLWINSNDTNVAGFITGKSNTIAYDFRMPQFYPVLTSYKHPETPNENEFHDIMNYKPRSYGHMLSSISYRSPHFSNALRDDTPLLVNSDVRDGNKLYYLSDNNAIYDPWFSSYYIRIQNNKLTTYYHPSRLRRSITSEEDASSYPLNLRTNVDIMLKYLADVDYDNGYEDIYFEDGCRNADPFMYRRHLNIRGYNHIDSVRLFPMYLNVLDNNNINQHDVTYITELIARSSNSTNQMNLYYRISSGWYMNDRYQNLIVKDEGSSYFNEALNGGMPMGLVTLGKLKNFQYDSSYTGIANDTVSIINIDESKYPKIFSNDIKWISVPYQDQMLAIGAFNNDEIRDRQSFLYPFIPNNSSEVNNYYTNRYLAPYNLDHVVRQYNIKQSDTESQSAVRHPHRNKILISGTSIKSYKTSDNVYRLFNDANKINSLKWGINKNGKHILIFENTSMLLKDNVQLADE